MERVPILYNGFNAGTLRWRKMIATLVLDKALNGDGKAEQP